MSSTLAGVDGDTFKTLEANPVMDLPEENI